MIEKSFYVISALLPDSQQLGNAKRFDTESEAVEHAKAIIQRRRNEGASEIAFYTLKVTARVGPASPPIEVRKFRGGK